MDMENKLNTSPIELPSKKVRNVIGDIPNGLLYWGIIVVIFIMSLLTAIIVCVPYPYSNGESIFQHIFGSVRFCQK